MPYINTRGNVAHGRGGLNASLDNVAFAPGGVAGWMDDDTIGFTDKNNGWAASAFHVPTKSIQQRAPIGGNDIFAGGGHMAWFLDSHDANQGVHSTTSWPRQGERADGTPYDLTLASVAGMGPDGSIAYKPIHHSMGPTLVRELDGTEWELTPEYTEFLQLLGNRRAIYTRRGAIYVVGLPQPVYMPGPFRVSAAFVAGEWWLSYWTEKSGIITHPFNSFNGFPILSPGLDGWHIISALGDDTMRMACGTSEAEQDGQMWVRDFQPSFSVMRDPWAPNTSWQSVARVDVRTIGGSVGRPPDPEVPVMTFRSRDEILPYLNQRWSELGGPDVTTAVAERTGIHQDKDLEGRSAEEKAWVEQQFKDVQCPLFVRIVGELYHTKGFTDVGLSTKKGGNNWNGFATDILALKPREDANGNHQLIDAMTSMGGPEARPTWDDKGMNKDNSRPWAVPPVPSGAAPPAAATHKYIGGGNDTSECDQCHKSRFDPIHRIPESQVPHKYDGGEQDTGLCDICQMAVGDEIHSTTAPGPVEPPPADPTKKHKFVGTLKFCPECGKGPNDPIHQLDPVVDPTKPAVIVVDLRETNLKLDELIAIGREQTKAIDNLRASVIASVKDVAKVLGGGGILAALGGGKKAIGKKR